MPELLELEVATPERILVQEEVDEVQIPTVNGFIGILPGHAPLVAELATGYMHYQAGARRWYLATHGGFVEVKDNHIRVLADIAERAEEIDIDRARQARERAQAALVNPALGVAPAFALAAMQRAEARLEAARHR
jgi:F-type H+-transporting ATPase subunit epsilon